MARYFLVATCAVVFVLLAGACGTSLPVGPEVQVTRRPVEVTRQPMDMPEQVQFRQVSTDTPTPTATATITPTNTPTPTVTPTSANRIEFTSHDGTPTQVPILEIGFSNAAAATPDPSMTPTATPTAEPTAITCVEPTALPTVISTVGPSLPGSIPLPIDDTFICDDQSTQNFGNASTMSLNDGCSLLLRWPLDATMRGKTIRSATLRLFVIGQPAANAGDSVFFVNETISPRWTELGATWENRTPSTAWNTAGARGANTDYNTTAAGYVYIEGNTTGWVDVALSPTMVQGWISNPSGNMGVVVWSSTAQNDVRITSSEWYDRRYRPQLILETTE